MTLRRSILLALIPLGIGMVAGTPRPADAADVRLIGSGASFPFPIYATWFKAFSKATDAAMTDEQIAQVKGGVVLLPMTAGEIVLAYNLPGVSELKLPRDLYPEIFLGNVTSWNDPRIVAANPGVDLPDTKITVVRRSDSSGTTFVFTKHLSAVSEAFKNGPGFGTTVQWPDSASIIAAPKNDGVTATIKQTPGAIGYIEYGYAKLSKAPIALLTGAKFPSDIDLRAWIDDPQEPGAYPIATFTWMLFYKEQDAAKAEALRQMVEYSLTEGQKIADSMGYIPLPEAVIEKVRAASAAVM
jgi:phosphate transport system substrate-binding protein